MPRSFRRSEETGGGGDAAARSRFFWVRIGPWRPSHQKSARAADLLSAAVPPLRALAGRHLMESRPIEEKQEPKDILWVLEGGMSGEGRAERRMEERSRGLR